jgi:hypothetical protein
VVEGHVGGDVVLEELIDETIVESDASRLDGSESVRNDPAPGCGEAVSGYPGTCHEIYILGVPVVVIAGYVAGAAIVNASGFPDEAIPNRFAFAVLVPSPLYLIGRSGHTEDEIVGEAIHVERLPAILLRAPRTRSTSSTVL